MRRESPVTPSMYEKGTVREGRSGRESTPVAWVSTKPLRLRRRLKLKLRMGIRHREAYGFFSMPLFQYSLKERKKIIHSFFHTRKQWYGDKAERDRKEIVQWQFVRVLHLLLRQVKEMYCMQLIWIVIRCNVVAEVYLTLCFCMCLCRFLIIPGSVFVFSAWVLWGIPGQSEVLTFSFFSQPVSSGCLLCWAPKADCGSVGEEMRKTKSWLSGQLAPLISPLVSSLTATLVCG